MATGRIAELFNDDDLNKKEKPVKIKSSKIQKIMEKVKKHHLMFTSKMNGLIKNLLIFPIYNVC